MGALSDFLEDVDRYRLKPRSRLGVILLNQGLWACAVYRFLRPLVRHRVGAVRRVGHFLSIPAKKWIEIVAGISLPPQCDIGPGLYIGHFGTVVVNPKTRLGRHCNLGHGVTIGSGGRGERDGRTVEGVPTIGDRVYIGAGACLFGPIEVGDDVAVGANAVVTRSLPARAVVVGIPAQIVSQKGSFEYVQYRGMEADASRLASLSQTRASIPDDDSPNLAGEAGGGAPG
jgi:serine O-acetyltransferase